ncbi:hypothetical protein [Promicromonospora sp. NPDC050880]|uniref:hypothetical protein n=1 Tax=Promicromonospora sp. NPDC050880 TaxID=3364406 RepID=UPI0037B14571
MNLLLHDAPPVEPIEFDVSGWPSAAEIEADELARAERAALADVEAELRGVLAAVEQAAAPVTGPLPIVVPLTKADAHDGAVAAVIEHVCDRLREIVRTRRTSELPDVVAMLEAVI